MSVGVGSRLSQAALAVGCLAVVTLVASFFLRSTELRAWVYSAAFAVAVVGLVLAAGDRLHERHERVAFRPQTRLGWWAVGLAALGIGVLVLGGVVLRALARDGGGPGVPLFVVTIAAFAALVAGGVVAAVAWFRQGERSWLVLAALLPALFAVYFVAGEFAFPH